MSAATGSTGARLWKARQFWGEFGWVITGNALSTLVSFVGVRLLTGLMSPSAYGRLSLAITATIFVQQIAFSPLANTALRFLSAAQEEGEPKAFLRAVLRLTGKACGALAALTLVLGVVFHQMGLGGYLALFAFALVFSIVAGVNGVLVGLQSAARNRSIVAIHDALGQGFRFLFAGVLISSIAARPESAAMLGYAAAAIVTLSSQVWFFKRRVTSQALWMDSRTGNLRVWENRLLQYAWPFVVTGLFAWAQISAERWVLGWVSNTGNVGLYTVVYQLGYYPMSLVGGVLFQFLTPILFSIAGSGADPERMARAHAMNRAALKSVVAFIILATAFCAFFHERIFELMVGAEYRSVSLLLPLMVLSGGLFTLGYLQTLFLHSSGLTKALLLPKIVSSSAAVLITVPLALWWGITGVAISSLISSALSAATMYASVRRIEERSQ